MELVDIIIPSLQLSCVKIHAVISLIYLEKRVIIVPHFINSIEDVAK